MSTVSPAKRSGFRRTSFFGREKGCQWRVFQTCGVSAKTGFAPLHSEIGRQSPLNHCRDFSLWRTAYLFQQCFRSSKRNGFETLHELRYRSVKRMSCLFMPPGIAK